MFKSVNLLACSLCVHLLLSVQDSSTSFECSGGSCFTYSIPPQNIVANSRLDGFQLRSLKSSTLFKCLDACSMDCRCMSFHFHHSEGTCFLNWRDNETKSLTADNKHTYYNMQVANFETDLSKSCDDVCCAGRPCKNGGKCDDLCHHHRIRFNCTCADGFTGRFCETDIDECSSSPCQNGAACLDQVNGFSCLCSAGYAGTHCETDIDECASNPCPARHDCVDHVNSFECVCSVSYYGNDCVQQASDCANYYNATSNTYNNSWYGLVDNNGNTYMAYCSFLYNLNLTVSTLVMSYSYGNNSIYHNKPLYTDFPRNENTTGWSDFRLSKARMEALQARSSHWRLTCNYDTPPVKQFIQVAFTEQSIITYNGTNSTISCVKIASGNLKGRDITGKYVRCIQEVDKIFYVYPSSGGQIDNCPIPQSGMIVEKAYFGYYEPRDVAFECAQNSGTTQLWFEKTIV